MKEGFSSMGLACGTPTARTRPTLAGLTAILFVVLVNSGCATRAGQTARFVAKKQDLRGALTQPLQDFNVLHATVPMVLRQAKSAPYAMPDPNTCLGIRYELAQLDDALGPDTDVLDPMPSGLVVEGANRVAKSAVAAVRDLSTGWIPMRSWVRTMTGAERNSKNLRKLINAGLMRRAYLRGIGRSQDCDIHAAPLPTQFPAPPPTPSSAG